MKVSKHFCLNNKNLCQLSSPGFVLILRRRREKKPPFIEGAALRRGAPPRPGTASSALFVFQVHDFFFLKTKSWLLEVFCHFFLTCFYTKTSFFFPPFLLSHPRMGFGFGPQSLQHRCLCMWQLGSVCVCVIWEREVSDENT